MKREHIEKAAEKVYNLGLERELAENHLLAMAGWKTTSKTLDFTWRWEKKVSGRIWSLTRKEALKLVMDEFLMVEDDS